MHLHSCELSMSICLECPFLDCTYSGVGVRVMVKKKGLSLRVVRVKDLGLEFRLGLNKNRRESL